MIPESHKAIGNKLHSHFENEYGISLNKKKLLWGSISPDVLPKYKFIGHYKEESLGYISSEVLKLILKFSLVHDFKEINPVLLRSISYNLGVISHYLTDYTTHPHARRIRCISRASVKEHIKYEVDLNEFMKTKISSDFSFYEPVIEEFSGSILDYKSFITQSIDTIVEDYLGQPLNFQNDIDYALGLNIFVFKNVLEAANSLNLQPQLQII